ncbi:Cysteine dioxygenase type 1 [Sarcoptes scabiei]|uniref:Cysteine dioxygenase n=1 Tax=Sarcoptes scabiei TaxID=52283 RepID=A0A834R5A6_SARSC|nr:Cysteine dioxygenase type 1 [Sarcoptes scabiei]UXI20787.1 allergen [Sarcoptes scabiei]
MKTSISFEELVDRLALLFESDKVDVDELKELMASYKSKPSEWYRYVKLSKTRYTRILIDGGNGKYNLMLLCWPPTLGSSIHNHPDSHCILKVLGGSLTEVRYRLPNTNGEMIIDCENELSEQNSVAYINDSIGLHRVVNRDDFQPAFSLHLYCPPFDKCRVFDERTGQHQHVDCSFDPQDIVKFRVKHQIVADIDQHNHDVLLLERENSIQN